MLCYDSVMGGLRWPNINLDSFYEGESTLGSCLKITWDVNLCNNSYLISLQWTTLGALWRAKPPRPIPVPHHLGSFVISI